jgi:guanylate kinase
LNKIPLFDLDVKGAYSLREQYSDETLLIFLKPPSIDILAERLRSRNTETEEQIRKRLERAESEIEIGSNFDFVITNDTLSNTLTDIKFIIEKYVCTTNN